MSVKRLTVKAQLTPRALERIRSDLDYWFCESPECEVVYFSQDGSSVFEARDVQQAVFQKDASPDTLACYCFGHSRAAVARNPALEAEIRAHTRAGRCACEIKNPQGRCCLGNITKLTM